MHDGTGNAVTTEEAAAGGAAKDAPSRQSGSGGMLVQAAPVACSGHSRLGVRRALRTPSQPAWEEVLPVAVKAPKAPHCKLSSKAARYGQHTMCAHASCALASAEETAVPHHLARQPQCGLHANCRGPLLKRDVQHAT
eukprot:187276-Chlamydomonas_euryale.AAC.2